MSSKVAKGFFVTLEGIDGAGKATLMRRLKASYQASSWAGMGVACRSCPGYEERWAGKLLRSYLDGYFGGPELNHPLFVSLLYAMDRLEIKTKFFDVAAKSFGLILADRWTASNVAYQTARLVPDESSFPPWARKTFEAVTAKATSTLMTTIADMEQSQLLIPRPNLTFLVLVPPEVAAKRSGKKRNKDIYEENLKYQKKVAAIYRELAESPELAQICGQEWVLLGSDTDVFTADEIEEQAWRALSVRLQRRYGDMKERAPGR